MSDILPDAHFGSADALLPKDWRDIPDPDADDNLLPETPPDVVKMLGFDPATEDDEQRNDGMDIGKLDAIAGAVAALDGRLDAMEKRRADGGDEPGNVREPYGDVKYADPGLQPDKQKRYPIDTAEHVRAAWNYMHKHRDEDKYSAEQRKEIEGHILRAWKEKIGGEPPEARE